MRILPGGRGRVAICCDTVTLRPAIDVVADRTCAPVLTATANVTVPAPVPFTPDAIVIHEELSDADHRQPPGVAMLKLMLPPARGTEADVGETV
jgi:hypothetical protein